VFLRESELSSKTSRQVHRMAFEGVRLSRTHGAASAGYRQHSAKTFWNYVFGRKGCRWHFIAVDAAVKTWLV